MTALHVIPTMLLVRIWTRCDGKSRVSSVGSLGCREEKNSPSRHFHVIMLIQLSSLRLQEVPHIVIPNLFRDLFFEGIYDDESVNLQS